MPAGSCTSFASCDWISAIAVPRSRPSRRAVTATVWRSSFAIDLGLAGVVVDVGDLIEAHTVVRRRRTDRQRAQLGRADDAAPPEEDTRTVINRSVLEHRGGGVAAIAVVIASSRHQSAVTPNSAARCGSTWKVDRRTADDDAVEAVDDAFHFADRPPRPRRPSRCSAAVSSLNSLISIGSGELARSPMRSERMPTNSTRSAGSARLDLVPQLARHFLGRRVCSASASPRSRRCSAR